MERYDSYKDSGVKWLGEIPSHWEVKRLRAALTERKERYSNLESLMILSLIKDKGIIPYDEKGEVGNKSKDDHTQYKVARKGDLVINSMNVIIGSLGITPYDGYISPAYYSFKPCDEVNLTYYNYILSLRRVQQSIRCFSKGIMEIRLKISAYDFLSMPFPFPTLKEQETIANYLNTATSKIEEAIAQQQKMIDLLNERKQIIINNAVTKGLDPNVKMKPSCIDWIGDIPEHWEIAPIKRYNKVYTGKTPSTSKESYFEEGDINWYTPGDLNQFKLNNSERKVTEIAKREDACPMFPPNTVYLVGIGGTIGKVSYSELEASCNQQINAIVTQKEYVYYKYLAYFLQVSRTQVYQNANLSTLPIINQERTGALIMLIPSLVEQTTIVRYIEKVSKPIDDAIEASSKQISLLQERKQIIINDVVTGKVKVI